MTRFQFVADHQDAFEVKRLCELVEIERSSYYAWTAAAPGRDARAAADAELAEKIRTIHADDNTVGAPRATAELNDGAPAQERVNHKRVARVMREHGIAGYQKKPGSRQRSPSHQGRRSPTCSSGTSPQTRRTSAMSATSPTCRWPTARICTWPR